MSEAFFGRMLSGVDFCGELFTRQTSRSIGAGPLVMANSGEPFAQYITATAAANVQLPLETANAGKLLCIVNTSAGAFALTFQSNAGAALSPAVTAAQNKATLLLCDGVAWRALISA